MRIKALFNAAKVAICWDRAASLGSQGKYELALQKIAAAEQMQGVQLPPTFQLLKAVLLNATGKPAQAIGCAVEAHARILSAGRWRSEFERAYLASYVSVLGLQIMEEQRYTGRHNFAVDYSSVDLGKVPGATKKVFPLRSHPAWQ